MKKYSLILLIILAFCLTGCVVEGDASEQTSAESQTDTVGQTVETESDTVETTHEIPNEPEDDHTKRY